MSDTSSNRASTSKISSDNQKNSRNSNSSRTNQSLDMQNINHEAIRNDMYLKSVSKKPSAFNNHSENSSSFETEYDDFDPYDELELMVKNPELEEAMRKVVEDTERLNILQGKLRSQQRHEFVRLPPPDAPRYQSRQYQSDQYLSDQYQTNQQQTNQHQASQNQLNRRQSNHHPPSLLSQESKLPLEQEEESKEELKEDKPQNLLYFYLSKWFELIIFQVFMVYWIVKEPIIRTLTFFTMIVSALLVSPTLFLYTYAFNQGLPNNERRKHITYTITGALFLWLLYTTYPHVKQYIPDDYWRPATNSPSDLSVIQGYLSQWESRLKQMDNKQSSYESLYDDLSSRGNSNFQAVKNQLDKSTAEILQMIAAQQGDNEKINKQYYFMMQKLIEIEKRLQENVAELLQSDKDIMNYIDEETPKHIKQNIEEKFPREMADFALESRGSHVIHWMTSKTFQPMPQWVQTIRRMLGTTSRLFTLPEMALQPQIHVGECWSMDGTSGDLGILLSQSVKVNSITIEYPTLEAMNFNMSTAPKNIQVIGLRDYRTSSENTFSLGLIQYDINKNQSAQVFQLDNQRQLVFEAVLIKVLSNWGNTLRTDLYRIRIHNTFA